MQHVRRLSLAVLIAAASCGSVAGCGGSDGGRSGTSATEILRETFGPGHPIRSGRLDLSLHLATRGLKSLSAPIDLRLSGPFATRGTRRLPDFALTLDFLGRRPVTIGIVSTGRQGFVTLQGRAYDLGAEAYAALQRGYAQSEAAATAGRTRTTSLSALGIEPARWLRDPRRRGTEDVAGTRSDHLVAGIDVARLLADLDRLLATSGTMAGAAAGRSLPSSIAPRVRAAIERSVRSATVDVWSGTADHTLRRFALELRMASAPADRAAVGGLQTGVLTFTATLAELNRPQRIVAPAGARPLSELSAGLRELGFGTGTGAAAPSTTNGSSGASSSAQDAYAACLAKAGNDLAAAQRCAGLVGAGR